MRWFMELAYRGAPFHGWQIQPGAESVQGRIEQALATILRRPVPIVGAGRTDAGVNARQMIAHLDLPDGFDGSDAGFLRGLNSLVGNDIAIYALSPVAPQAHARFDASERAYRYYATTAKDPFSGPLAWRCSPQLDFDAMNEAAAMLIGRRDFTSFAKLHTDVKTNICDLRQARWVHTGGSQWYFEIAADRFLRNMVRAVVGTLVEVGRHKITPEGIMDILDRKDRCAAGTSMPAEALFLHLVSYPDDIYTSSTPH